METNQEQINIRELRPLELLERMDQIELEVQRVEEMRENSGDEMERELLLQYIDRLIEQFICLKRELARQEEEFLAQYE